MKHGRALRLLGRVLIGMLLLLACGVVWLIVPGRPGSSQYMHFDGYRVLPRNHLLEAFDYFSFHDGMMYVASTSGGVFQVVSGSSDETVQQMAGAGQAHGVAFDPASGLGFSTHSGFKHHRRVLSVKPFGAPAHFGGV